MRLTHSLNGEWRLALDPGNQGQSAGWPYSPSGDAQLTPVPGAIEETFPGYDGLVWYWRTFVPPLAPLHTSWAAVRFWAADYYADVWLNGHHVGSHEGGETPFTLPFPAVLHTDKENLLAVRLIHPGHDPIDGMDLAHIPHGIKRAPFRPGAGHNYGGIWQPVELLALPVVYISDLFPQPTLSTGELIATITVINSSSEQQVGKVELTVMGPDGSDPIASAQHQVTLVPGETQCTLSLHVSDVQPWSLDQPALYVVNARLEIPGMLPDYQTRRCGFREFTFRDGYFHLNGRRLILKGTHTVGHYPIGLVLPRGPEMLRQELMNLKMMGINCCRSLGRMMFPQQLDMCDEIGLLVYEETLAAWNWQSSPQLAQRFDHSVRGMIRRDRHHPSVVIWGLLNETLEGEIFQHAVGMLPQIRALDPTRMVLLDSGRWDTLTLDQIGALNTGNYAAVQAALQETRSATGAAALPYQQEWSALFADYHRYVTRPLADHAIETFRRLGTPDYRLFQSEFGNGSALDPVRITRLFEQNGARDDLDDGTLYRHMADRLEHDFERLGLAAVFAHPSDLVRASETLQAQARGQGIAALRANPNLCGYSITGMLDHTMVGEGLMTIFREPKQATIDALRDAWHPLQWSIFTHRTSIYRGDLLRVEAILVNEDVLPPGTYLVRLRVTGPAGCVAECHGHVTIPQSSGLDSATMVYPVFDEQLLIDGPAGRYEIRVFFEHGGAALGRAHVYVSDPLTPQNRDGTVSVWDSGSVLTDWLERQGITVQPFDPTAPGPIDQTIVVNAPDIVVSDAILTPLLDWISEGGTAVFLSPRTFGLSEDAHHGVFYKGQLTWCPFGENVQVKQARGCWWAVDHVVKNHPLVSGLPSGRLMDLHYYRLIHPHWTYVGLRDGDVAIAGLGIGTCGEEDNYWAGTDLVVVPWGEGRAVLSTLLVAEYLGQDPAADRLMLNLATLTMR